VTSTSPANHSTRCWLLAPLHVQMEYVLLCDSMRQLSAPWVSFKGINSTSEKPLLASRCLCRMRASAEPSPKMAPATKMQGLSIKRGPAMLGMHSCGFVGNGEHHDDCRASHLRHRLTGLG
jgi:hypothetical protein